jgi:MoxR-like ATPase
MKLHRSCEEPIASRTRSTSSRSNIQKRTRRGVNPKILSESDDSELEFYPLSNIDSSDEDSDEDSDDLNMMSLLTNSDSRRRRSRRDAHPPKRFTFESHITEMTLIEREAESQEYLDYRKKGRLLKEIRKTTDTDPDPLMQFLEECNLEQCQHYHDRHQQLEAMGVADRPLRIQLYDHLPELTPDNARLVFSKIRQIEEMDPFSTDGAKLSGWAQTVLSVPFGQRTEIHAPDGLAGVLQELDRGLYGQAAAKDAMLQAAAQMLACPTAKPRVVALVGPPGVGKTTMARGLGDALGMRFFQMGLGGESDAHLIKGHSMTYDGGQHGAPLGFLIRGQTMNPLVLLDEIDKLSDRHGSEMTGVLTHLLDSTQSCDFTDDFVGFGIDFSGIFFVVTLNDLSRVDSVLRDRLHVVHFISPTAEEKAEIICQHVLPRLLQNSGFQIGDVTMTADDVRHAITRCPKEDGVRILARSIESCVLRLNVLRMGGVQLDVPYRHVPAIFPMRLTAKVYDQLTKSDPLPDRPNQHMYM